MWKKFKLLIPLILISFSVQTYAGIKRVQVLSFQAWKLKKVNEAKSQVTDLRVELKKVSHYGNLDEAGIEQVRRRLYQAELNVGVMEELSGNDYLLLYIFPQFKNRKDVLAIAAKSLNSKEWVDVLMGYQAKTEPDPGESSADRYVVSERVR